MRSRTPQDPPAPRTPEERRPIRAAIAQEEARAGERLARLAAQVTEARGREERARDLLTAARAHRVQCEGEQLAESTASERRLADLRRQLAAGAGPAIAALQADVRALVDHARTKVETWVGTGWQDVNGRRPTTVSSNADEVAVLLGAAQQLTQELEALRHAEDPDLERLGPFAQVTIPDAQLQWGTRHDEPPMLVGRTLIVPAALAEQFAAIGGVSSPTPLLSPAEVREAEWDAERSLQRRWNSGEAWR